MRTSTWHLQVQRPNPLQKCSWKVKSLLLPVRTEVTFPHHPPPFPKKPIHPLIKKNNNNIFSIKKTKQKIHRHRPRHSTQLPHQRRLRSLLPRHRHPRHRLHHARLQIPQPTLRTRSRRHKRSLDPGGHRQGACRSGGATRHGM